MAKVLTIPDYLRLYPELFERRGESWVCCRIDNKYLGSEKHPFPERTAKQYHEHIRKYHRVLFDERQPK